MRLGNRKKKKTEGFMVSVAFAVVMVMASLFSLGYLWLGSRCEALAADIHDMEARRADVHKKRVLEESRWATMKSPRRLEEHLRKHGLRMTWPSRDQIVRLSTSDAINAIAEGIQGGALGARVAMND